MSLKSYLSQQFVKLAARLQNIKFDSDSARAGIIELPMWKTDYPLPFSGNLKKNMAVAQQLATVWRCITIISDAVSPIPLLLLKKDEEGNEKPAKHDISFVLEWVNPWMSGDDLWAETTAFYKLCGNAYWAFEKEFTQIWVLRPDRVKIIPNQQNFIESYEYKNETTQKKVIFKPEEIVHFKGLSLETVFYGESPIEPGAKELGLEKSAIDYNYRYFENDATPSGVLQAQHEIDQEELKRIQRVWESAYKGTKKAHRVAVLDKNLKYEKVADSLKDMNFENLRRFNKEQILMLLGVPPAIAGDLTHADYANIKHQDKLFYSYTIIPILRKFETILNQILLPRFKGTDGLFFKFDLSGIEALQDTLGEKATTASTLVNGRVPIITINEARMNILNMPKIEDSRADELQFTPVPNIFGLTNPNSMDEGKVLEIPVRNRMGELVEVKTNGKEHKENEIVFLHKFETGIKEPVKSDIITEPIEFPLKTKEDQRDILWKKFDERLIRQEKLFEKDMRGFFKKQLDRVLEKFDEFYPEKTITGRVSRKQINPTTDEIIFDIIKENGNLKIVVQRRVQKILEMAYALTSEDFNIEIDFDLTNPAVQNFLAVHESMVNVMNQTTKERIAELVSEAIQEGKTTQELRDSLIDQWETWEGTEISPGRAMTIARTETSGAYNFGSFQAAKESGIIDRKWWLSARDEKVRESHARMEAETMDSPIPVDSLFSNGLMYPGEQGKDPAESINCRCVINYLSSKE